jgi:2-oxoglutarate ferredoxin oxidoreductase subunit gamma
MAPKSYSDLRARGQRSRLLQLEVLLTGIGGQGVQLAAKTLAMAATAEGHQVLMSSHYGGEMRGGQTEASVVVADEGLRTVPILESVWSAFVMHSRYWPGVEARLRPGGVVVANSSAASDIPDGDYRVIAVPAGEIAVEVGAAMSAGFVLLGAYSAVTGLVGLEALVGAMKELVPPYRTQHLAVNEAALRAGAASQAAPLLGGGAW